MTRMWTVAAGVTAALTGAPAGAQIANPLTAPGDTGDSAVREEVAAAIASRTPDLPTLDELLARLPRPTPLRGVIQTVRAGVLARRQDAGPAVSAIEEALRLLPDDPRPKLIASYIYTFSGSPARAADSWMQASRLSPGMARASDRYIMSALVARLTESGDRVRADRLSARLAEIGFSTGLAPERSSAALAHLRETLRGADAAGAAAGVTAIANPDDLLGLYVDARYAALWPRIAEWASADLSAQSRRYLEELRGEWDASDSFAAAVPYARQLTKLGAYDATVNLFRPMFERRSADVKEGEQLFLAPVVARALANLGRAVEARAVLAEAATMVPDNDMGNALNIDGAYLTLAAEEMDWLQVVTRADAFLDRAKPLGQSINRSALIAVTGLRACALSRLGQADEASRAATEVLLAAPLVPEPAMDLHLCRGDRAAARALVIARLTDESTRDWALRFVQPVVDRSTTPLNRATAPIAQSVRTDPAVIAAAAKVGRVLPQPVNATLPAGFDPFRPRTRRQPLRPGEI